MQIKHKIETHINISKIRVITLYHCQCPCCVLQQIVRMGEEELCQAAKQGDVSEVRKELAAGTNIEAVWEGKTALMWAAREDRVPVVEFLLSRGAQPNTRGAGGSTALYHATVEGNVESVRLLLAKGADINAPDNRGVIPLHSAGMTTSVTTVWRRNLSLDLNWVEFYYCKCK